MAAQDDEAFVSSRHDKEIRIADWVDAEHLAAWHMSRRLGFEDATVTKSGNDGGIDVESADAVAQVKHHTNPVGGPEIQQLRGAAHGRNAALFYALSGYTTAGERFADKAGVALFRYDIYGEVTGCNEVAHALQASGPLRSAELARQLANEQAAQQQRDAERRQAKKETCQAEEQAWLQAGRDLAGHPSADRRAEIFALIRQRAAQLTRRRGIARRTATAVLHMFSYNPTDGAKRYVSRGGPQPVLHAWEGLLALEKEMARTNESLEEAYAAAESWDTGIREAEELLFLAVDSLSEPRLRMVMEKVAEWRQLHSA
jgi:hypothetical protein